MHTELVDLARLASQLAQSFLSLTRTSMWGIVHRLSHLPGIYLDAGGFKLLSSSLPCKFTKPSSQIHIATFEPRCGILSEIPLRIVWPRATSPES